MADIELIIKVPENNYNQIKSTNDFYLTAEERLIKYGTPISDNATNGDAVKTLFSNTFDNFCERTTWEWNRWWNAPYQKRGK